MTVASTNHDIIQLEKLQLGSVVCDRARPLDVSVMVAATRNDILVINVGMVDVPGPVDFHFNFGIPPEEACACMAETCALALENRFEDYTLGKELPYPGVKEIVSIAGEHGFRQSGYRSFEHEVKEEQLDSIHKRASQARKSR